MSEQPIIVARLVSAKSSPTHMLLRIAADGGAAFDLRVRCDSRSARHAVATLQAAGFTLSSDLAAVLGIGTEPEPKRGRR